MVQNFIRVAEVRRMADEAVQFSTSQAAFFLCFLVCSLPRKSLPSDWGCGETPVKGKLGALANDVCDCAALPVAPKTQCKCHPYGRSPR